MRDTKRHKQKEENNKKPLYLAGIPRLLISSYNAQKPSLDKALADIKIIIIRQLAKIGDQNLIRASLREARVKKLPSLWSKAQRFSWEPEKALLMANDILGIRIICNNLEDVDRAKDLIQDAPELELIPDSIQDYFKNSKDGYRALHFVIKYEANGPSENNKIPMNCEIQIRTHLADSWARLSHRDFYKDIEKISTPQKKLLKRLADLLCVADDIAQDLREQISQRRSVTLKPETELVTKDTLAFIYQIAFKSAPPEYLLEIVDSKCKELGITRSDSLDRKLRDPDFLKKIRSNFVKGYLFGLSDESTFELIPTAVAFGDHAAIEKAKQKAKEELEEIDRVYKSELLSSLPETYKLFLDSFKENRDSWHTVEQMVYDAAEIFDAYHECSMCGCRIVVDDILAENIAEHYEVEDKIDEIKAQITHLGIETESWNDNNLCSHCYYILNKND
jgi:ppGpp synthetase/RelA/SpoT-type nucleotidyltranferase